MQAVKMAANINFSSNPISQRCTVFATRSDVKRLLNILILIAFHRVSVALRLCSGSSCIDIFVHVRCYPETMPMSRIVKKPCSIFKTKRSTELKTSQQINV